MNKPKISILIFAGVMLMILVGANIFINKMNMSKQNSTEKMLIGKVTEEANAMNEEFVKIETSLKTIADQITSRDTYDEALLKDTFETLLKTEKMYLRAGYWFEPEQFQPGERFHAYFFSKGGNTITLTKEYSNVDYDYHMEDWYKEGMAETKDIFYTPPFFDTAMKLYMMTAEKKFEKAGKPIGLVNLDLNLKRLSERLKSIKVGTAGTAFIVTEDGLYMGERTRTHGDLQKKITEESDVDLKALGISIMEGKFDQLHKIASNKSFAISHPIGKTGLTLVLFYPQNSSK